MITAYLQVGAIENASPTEPLQPLSQKKPLGNGKSYFQYIYLALVTSKPLQEFKAVSFPFLGPEMGKEKLLKAHNYAQEK